MGVLLPSCHDMTRHSSARLDHPARWWRLPGQWLHIAFCRLCRRYRRQLGWVHRAASHADSSAAAQSAMPPASKDRLKQALRIASASGASGGSQNSDVPQHPSHD